MLPLGISMHQPEKPNILHNHPHQAKHLVSSLNITMCLCLLSYNLFMQSLTTCASYLPSLQATPQNSLPQVLLHRVQVREIFFSRHYFPTPLARQARRVLAQADTLSSNLLDRSHPKTLISSRPQYCLLGVVRPYTLRVATLGHVRPHYIFFLQAKFKCLYL